MVLVVEKVGDFMSVKSRKELKEIPEPTNKSHKNMLNPERN